MRRWRWWLLPVVLAMGLLVGGAMTQRDAIDDTATVVSGVSGEGRTTTTVPLLPPSAPETTVPLADQRLQAELQQLVARLPVDSCLVVEGPGVRFAHRGETPLVPASTLKLLTATAALEALGPETLITSAPGQQPVREVVNRMLRDSDDEAAALLLAEIGRVEADPTDGAAAIVQLIDDGDVDLQGVVVTDSSGHSRDNRVTCAALVDVLSRPETGALVHEGLAVAGESGTLADRFVGTTLQGIMRAKTGSLSSVSALAGVVDDGDDPALLFALVVNVPPGVAMPDDVAQTQQQVGEAMVAWGG